MSASRPASALQRTSTPRLQVGASERAIPTNTNGHESPFWGCSMNIVVLGDDRPEPIFIARCRELLGDEADTLTDQDLEMICRHAETMAQIVVQMFVESRRISG